MPHHTDISVQIAPTLDDAAPYEVRVIGPGGWRRAYRGDLSQARADAYAWSVVLRCAIEDLSPEALRCDALGAAEYAEERGR